MSDPWESRAIVTTVPKTEQEYVLHVKFTFDGSIYWRLPCVPAHPVARVYFVWDGAVRMWRMAREIEEDYGYRGVLIWLDDTDHLIDPLPMESFRGYRWFNMEATQ